MTHVVSTRGARHRPRRPAHARCCSSPPRPPPRSYVALGDSYASGTGTRSYISDGTSCQRSTQAYPSLIAAARGYALNFRACSGATIPDVTNTQLSALTSATTYVTISVGGNDAGLRRRADRVRAARLDEQLRRRDQHRPVLHQRHPARAARHALLRHPQPRAVRQGGRGRLPADLQRRGLQRLHLVLPRRGVAAQPDRRPAQLAARPPPRRRAGFSFANPTSRFVGHAVCDSDEWINGLSNPISGELPPQGHRPRQRLHARS